MVDVALTANQFSHIDRKRAASRQRVQYAGEEAADTCTRGKGGERAKKRADAFGGAALAYGN